jgi:transcriptional regulator
MYAPPPYLHTDPILAADLIDRIVMGTLVVHDEKMHGSPLPFSVKKKLNERGDCIELVLISHMDKSNPLWRCLDPNKDIFISFFGPNCYFSPSHYTTSPRAPTWLYATVHITGKPKIIHEAEDIANIVTHLTNKMEPSDSGWNISQITGYRDALVNHIVGFEISVSKATSQVRLGQTNSRADKKAMLSALKKGGSVDQCVANLIADLKL